MKDLSPRKQIFGNCHCIERASCILDPFLLSLESKYWDEWPSYDSRYVQKTKQQFLTNDKGNIHIRTHFSIDNEWIGHHLMQHHSPASSAQSRMTMRHKQRLLPHYKEVLRFHHRKAGMAQKWTPSSTDPCTLFLIQIMVARQNQPLELSRVRVP